MSNKSMTLSNELDLLNAESEIRAAAQKAFALAIVRSIKVGFRTALDVLSEASEMQKKHAKKYNSGAI